MTRRRWSRRSLSSQYAVFLGLDFGKGEHHACALDPTGKGLHDRPLPNDEAKLRALFERLAHRGRVLMVVDQPAWIGALPVAVARAVGCQVAASGSGPPPVWPGGRRWIVLSDLRAPGRLRRAGPGQPDPRNLHPRRTTTQRRQLAPRTRHVPGRVRVPVRPDLPRLLPAQTRPRQTTRRTRRPARCRSSIRRIVG
jgi:hypothetical protein